MKTCRKTKTLEFLLESGQEDLVVEVDVTATWLYNSNYGVDADGNRGTEVWELENIDYEAPKDLTEDQLEELRLYIDSDVESWDVEDNGFNNYEDDKEVSNYQELIAGALRDVYGR